jgi:hypothetical protein
VRFFPFLRFSSYEFSWRQQSLYVVSFSSYFSHRVLRSFNNISNTTLLIFLPSGFWGRYYKDIKIKENLRNLQGYTQGCERTLSRPYKDDFGRLFKTYSRNGVVQGGVLELS